MRAGETGGGRAVDPGMTAPKRRAVGGTPGLVQWDMMDFDDHPDRAGGAKVLGGAEGNRTPDLRSAIAALSHLSYSPVEAPAL